MYPLEASHSRQSALSSSHRRQASPCLLEHCGSRCGTRHGRGRESERGPVECRHLRNQGSSATHKFAGTPSCEPHGELVGGAVLAKRAEARAVSSTKGEGGWVVSSSMHRPVGHTRWSGRRQQSGLQSPSLPLSQNAAATHASPSQALHHSLWLPPPVHLTQAPALFTPYTGSQPKTVSVRQTGTGSGGQVATIPRRTHLPPTSL